MLAKLILAITLLNPKVSLGRAEKYANVILRVANRRHVDPWIIVPLARTESGFDPLAYNQTTHARGLLQLMPVHMPDNPDKLYDLETNVDFAIKIFSRKLIECHGNIAGALSRYNGRRECKESIFSDKVLQRYKLIEHLQEPTS